MFSSLSGVDINIDVCVPAAGGRIETKNTRGKKEEKGDRDNVTKSACARSHKTKDQYKKKIKKGSKRVPWWIIIVLVSK